MGSETPAQLRPQLPAGMGVEPTRLQRGRLSGPAHRFLAARADAWLVDRLRSVAEGAVTLLHSENHDPRTNGEHALVRRLAPRLHVVVDVGANRGEWSRYVV